MTSLPLKLFRKFLLNRHEHSNPTAIIAISISAFR